MAFSILYEWNEKMFFKKSLEELKWILDQKFKILEIKGIFFKNSEFLLQMKTSLQYSSLKINCLKKKLKCFKSRMLVLFLKATQIFCAFFKLIIAVIAEVIKNWNVLSKECLFLFESNTNILCIFQTDYCCESWSY